MNIAEQAHAAFLYSYPLYEMARMRAATSPRRLPAFGFAGTTPDAPERWCNAFVHRRQLIEAGGSKVVTPNNDTLYSNAWLDLADGPLVIDVPDTAGRYYVLGLLDFFTNPFAHLGSRGHGTGAGAFLVTGPGWQGEVPSAFAAPGRHVRSATRWVWIIGRWLVDGPHDLAAVHALQDALQLRPLAAWQQGTGCEPKRFLPNADANAAFTASRFMAQMQRLHAEQPELWPDASLWPGNPALAPDMHQAIEGGLRELQAGDGGGSVHAGWTMPPVLGESFGHDFRRRAEVALKYIGALESNEAHYPMAWHDAHGQPLNGQQAYALHFGPGQLPPVNGFWSLTLYRRSDFFLVENPISRYAIGDRTQGLHTNTDGSLTLYIQGAAPATPQALANWLPAPAEPFYLCLRAYLPKPELLDGRYQLPGLVPANAS
jgi:hypothetical protein